jgi:iron complex outermembrane recepter protein
VDGYVNLRGYSNNLGLRSEVGVKGAEENGFVWSMNGALESHADYIDGDGRTMGNTRFNTQNLKAGVGLQKKWGDTRLRYTYMKQKLGILDENAIDELATFRGDRSTQSSLSECY